MKTHRKILLTGFRGSTAQELLRHNTDLPTLILPNDKVRDSKRLLDALSTYAYNYVVSFGQRPLIKNKIHIETTAAIDGDCIHTDFDCEKLAALFTQNGINAKLSHNAGTSYCNSLYYHGLQYIRTNGMDAHMVFIHIPFMKNIHDKEVFFERIINTIKSELVL